MDEVRDDSRDRHDEAGDDGGKHKEVEVTVDRKKHVVEADTYVVAKFKEIVGVAADKELDILKSGAFEPLGDNEKIAIRGGEVFVSHARTGGSS